jgi:hypothetical protein
MKSNLKKTYISPSSKSNQYQLTSHRKTSYSKKTKKPKILEPLSSHKLARSISKDSLCQKQTARIPKTNRRISEYKPNI